MNIDRPVVNRMAILLFAAVLTACATLRAPAPIPPQGAVSDPVISDIWDQRSHVSDHELAANPVEIAVDYDIPVRPALGTILGPTNAAARDSLALKIWLIENARHTVDVMYYIFNHDLAGYAMTGALCDAVKRGVDVRVMVDSLGSMGADKTALVALEMCEEEAGWMRNATGQVTDRRARVQVAIFNALTKLSGSPNRRSHDKLLVVDGQFPEHAWMMTGGRNISLDYYGITADGNIEPHTYRDSEILLRPGNDDPGDPSLGGLSAGYYSLLFLYKGNRLLQPVAHEDSRANYFERLLQARQALAKLKSLPIMQPHFQGAGQLLAERPIATEALLAHNMANLEQKKVVRNAVANLETNPNSILYVLNKVNEEASGTETARLVSPYLFLAQYRDEDGQVLMDEAQAIRDYLEANPEAEVEIITNSVLTSDNFSAQSVIDMDTAPRLLLDPKLREQWLSLALEDEATSDLVNSAAWIEAVNNPRLRIYEIGKLDADYLDAGGVPYGKLHAKFWLEGDIGFVGTDNFDYRSRLYNNEMGYFIRSEALTGQLNAAFEQLQALSYRWGSPEWLDMRRQVAAKGGMKGISTTRQRTVYKTLKATGLIWLF